MPRNKPERFSPIGDYWISKHPQRPDGEWCRTWYDPDSRQTRRVSLGTGDLQAASERLKLWYANHLLGLAKSESKHERPAGNGGPKPPESVLIEAVLLAYWEGHASKRPSADTEKLALGYWSDFWAGRTVSEITPTEQEKFRDWLAARPRAKASQKPLTKSGIDRILSPGRAALNRAVKYQTLTAAPNIFQLMTADMKRGRPPKGRPLSIEELAKLFDATTSIHMLRYLILGCGTLGRPAAIVELVSPSYDKAHQLIDLNTADREQNKKFRPLLPVVPTLRPWLEAETGKNGRYILYRGKPIQNILGAFRVLRRAAGLDAKVTPYSIRHTMARELRKRRVTTEEIGLFLGHQPDDSAATTSIYAPYEPDFMSRAIAAVEDVFTELAKLVRPGLLTPPEPGRKASLRKMKTGTAIAPDRRQQVRDMILGGVAHAQIVAATGVSSGTVSTIRKEVKAQVPLMRATGCVTLALSKGNA